jgi:hypothetical protein
MSSRGELFYCRTKSHATFQNLRIEGGSSRRVSRGGVVVIARIRKAGPR